MLLMLREKGKYASATQNRRFVWKEVVWPLILDVMDIEFSQQQYQKKRDDVCKQKNVGITMTSRGLASLLQRGLVYKENNHYCIHYRLIPYMRLKADCDYATAIHEVRLK